MSHGLIIEDDYFIAFSVQEALSQLGYREFDIVTSVREAVEAAQRRCPDLIVANHRITDSTGTDAVVAICAEKPIPVVFVTASGPEDRERLPDALIVNKPFSLPALDAAVSAAAKRPFRYRAGPDAPTSPPAE